MYKKGDILFFSCSYPPLLDATSKYNYQITRELLKKNSVEVIHIFFKEFKIIFEERNINRVRTQRIKIGRFIKNKFILKLVNFLNYSVECFLYLIKHSVQNKTLIVHSSPPIQIPLIAIYIAIKRIFRSKITLILIIHDLYPDILKCDLGKNIIIQFIKSFLYFLLLPLFKYSYNQFDKIFVCSNSIKDILIKKYNIREELLYIIYNWNLGDEIDFEKINYARNNLKLKDKKVDIIIIGNIGLIHLVKELSLLLKDFLNQNKNINLKCLVRGDNVFILKNYISNLKTVSFIETVPNDNLWKEYIRRSITIVSLSHIGCNYAFPSRLATALSFGSPIIFITDGDLETNAIAKLIKKYDIGKSISLNINSTYEIKKIYELIASDFYFYSNNARRCYEELMSKKINLNKLIGLIENTI